MGLEKLHLVMGLVFLATVVHIIAFATPGWVEIENINSGLWFVCTKIPVRAYIYWFQFGHLSKFEAVRAMECLALIAFGVSSASAILLLFKKHDSYRRLMAATAIAGGVFAIIGVAIFGADQERGLYYSFVLCIVGAILGFLAGIIGLFN